MAKRNDKRNSKRFIPAHKNISDRVFPGNAIRSRDEYFFEGKPKAEHSGNPREFYRKAYVIETNNLDELAVVKSTTKKGHFLKSKPDQKFKANVYTLDNDKNPIKISPKGSKNPKFIRSSADDLLAEDIDYIRKKAYKFSDSNEKVSRLKSRTKSSNDKRKK